MKSLGISDKDIKECIDSVNDENKIRDKVIDELKKKYDLYVERQDFPVLVYAIDIDDTNKIYIEHDCSRWLWLYTDEVFKRTSFDPLNTDCYDNVCNYIDNVLMDKNIKN